MEYTWIGFYEELANKLLKYKNNRPELIRKVINIFEKTNIELQKLESNGYELNDIDPFSIFGLFNKNYNDNKRITLLEEFKEVFNIKLDVPKSFEGVPVLRQNCLFYKFSDDPNRKPDDINNLWNLFEISLDFQKNDNTENRSKFIEAFNKAINMSRISWNITFGLFWIRPNYFIALDQKNRDFLVLKNIITREELNSYERNMNASSYLNIRNEIKKFTDKEKISFAELSYKAYEKSLEGKQKRKNEKEHIQYWVYTPGDKSTKWDEFYKDKIIATKKFDDLDNLKTYNKNDLKPELDKLTGKVSTHQNDITEINDLANIMKIGDIVFAKKGTKLIIGRGIVESDYIYDATKDEYRNYRKINWTHKGEWSHESLGTLSSKELTNITKYGDYAEKIENIVLNNNVDNKATPLLEDNSYTTNDFLNEVFIDENKYYTLVNLLHHKKNIILQGAPGVGKTYIAKRLAYSIIGKKVIDQVKMIQFHQSYSYEDFIMGYRPSDNGFELKNGVFYDFCKKAENDKGNDYFFIIDEINRGNLSKIFGELFMLLEADKRDEPIKLLYKDELFNIPSNVYIIGTMNTADRSLAMLDYALRRRFSFVNLEPAFDSEGFIEYQGKLENNRFNELIDKVKLLNQAIATDDSLGEGFCIGHSYFTNLKKNEVTIDRLNEIIEYEIIPLLNEYWFDEPNKVNTWTNELRESIE